MQHHIVMRSLRRAGLALALMAVPALAAEPTAPAIEKLDIKVAVAVADAWTTAQDAQKAAVLASINTTLTSVDASKKDAGRLVKDFPDGSHFEGNAPGAGISLGVLKGAATQDYAEFRGHVRGNVFQGVGVLVRKDGTRWYGHFENGRQTGYGARYDAKGGVAEQGIYDAGRLKTPLTGK